MNSTFSFRLKTQSLGKFLCTEGPHAGAVSVPMWWPLWRVGRHEAMYFADLQGLLSEKAHGVKYGINL